MTHRKRSGLCGALVGAGVLLHPGSALLAQELEDGVSLLTRLDTTGRTLEAGVIRTGELGEDALLLPGGERLQGWSFVASGGEWVQIDLASDDFDAYLYLAGAGLGAGLSDDDSGGELNSRICAQLPGPGPYTIVASSLGEGAGGYTLSLSRLPDPGADLPDGTGCTAGAFGEAGLARLLEDSEVEGVLRTDTEVTGLLDPFDPRHPERGGPVDIWEYRGVEGDRIAFDLASDDLDTYLYILGPEFELVGSDDDSGVGCTGSRVWITFPTDGSYRVLATSFGEGEEGSYRLIATPDPAEDLSCEWDQGTSPLASELSGIEVLPGRTLVGAELATPSASALSGGWSAISGVEIRGELSASDHPLQGGGVAQGWAIEALAGEGYRIELESSDFDPYLVVDGPGFSEPLWSDDDGGELNSRLEFDAAESGVHRLIVRAATGEGTGTFTLRVIRVTGGR